MNKKEDIVSGLKRLGITKGDTLFLRISYKAIGKTEGGPDTVIDAIEEVIGTEGTIIATAFPNRQLAFGFQKKIIYEPGKDITTGVIPVLLSKREGAYFSSNPISPFVCLGKIAKVLTEYHTPDKHNIDLITKAIEICSPKCLRIGGSALDGTTHIAFSEGLVKNHQYNIRMPEGIYYYDNRGRLRFQYQTMSQFCPEGFRRFYEQYILTDPSAVLGEGLIGQGKAVLTDMRRTLEIERERISPNPQILLCDNPQCIHCRSSYTYSEFSSIQYVFKLMKMKFSGEYTGKHLVRNIKDILLLFFLGRKCQ